MPLRHATKATLKALDAIAYGDPVSPATLARLVREGLATAGGRITDQGQDVLEKQIAHEVLGRSHATKASGRLRWTKVEPGVYHATSPWGLYTIDGNNYGRNRWTVTYPDSDYGMVDALAEAKLWAEQDAEQRAKKTPAHAKRKLNR